MHTTCRHGRQLSACTACAPRVENITIPHFSQVALDYGDTTRPAGIPDVKVFHWAQADISIPWLEGLTPRESIIEWAVSVFCKHGHPASTCSKCELKREFTKWCRS